MAARSELGRWIPRLVAVGILSLSCNPPGETSPGSKSQPQTQDCFIPANQRAALPEALARDIEAKCEPPAIPRRR